MSAKLNLNHSHKITNLRIQKIHYSHALHLQVWEPISFSLFLSLSHSPHPSLHKWHFLFVRVTYRESEVALVSLGDISHHSHSQSLRVNRVSCLTTTFSHSL